MLVLGLRGSPRVNGNTHFLLDTFMEACARLGARTAVVDAVKTPIKPCIGCGNCERKGVCSITDDPMKARVYGLLREAEAIVLSSPIYFYHATAQIKALIDRSQALWSRKYVFKLKDPACGHRRGFLLSVGATRGQNLFDGLKLTTRYFFDAVDAAPMGSLTYRAVEGRGDLKQHATVREEVARAAADLLEPLRNRPQVLFACRQNACRSQMAAAFAQQMAGERVEALCAGSEPAAAIDPVMVEAMQAVGIDMLHRRPQALQAALAATKPQTIVTMGCGEACPAVPGAERIDWDLPDPAGRPLEFMCQLRDEIRQRVAALVAPEAWAPPPAGPAV